VIILIISVEAKLISRTANKVQKNLIKDDNTSKEASSIPESTTKSDSSELLKISNTENKESNSSNTPTVTPTPIESPKESKSDSNNNDLDKKELECMKIFTKTITKLIDEKRALHDAKALNYNFYLALNAQKTADKMGESLIITDNDSPNIGETSYGMTTEKDFDFSEKKCESK
jgi:uncharacterized protein YkwD